MRDSGPFPFHYRIMEPRSLAAAPAGSRPPLVFFLHGIGADENDLLSIGRVLDPSLKVVSLRAPHDYYTGHSWFHIDFKPDGSVIPDRAQARASLVDLLTAVRMAPAAFGADPERIYLLGFSQGAMMSLAALQSSPDSLAGVMALSGRYNPDVFDRSAPDSEIAGVPLLVAHGTMDEVLPVVNGRQTQAAFEKVSKDFTYREFPIGHGISQDEIEWVSDWLEKRLQR